MIDGGLRKLFHARLRSWDWMAMETGAVCPGAPDSNACKRGMTIFVEFKATRDWSVKFRSLQPSWILRRVEHGGTVLVFVRQYRDGGDVLWAHHGRNVAELATGGLKRTTALALGQWTGGERQWDWGGIDELMWSECHQSMKRTASAP